MEDDDHDFDPASAVHPPSLVSLAPFSAICSPSPRRLSSCFIKPNHPVSSARHLARVSLQGRLLNVEEASSTRAIKGSLSPEEAVAWELFSPIQRFLIVAVIGVAVSESKKNRLISQLKKSVQLRDQVLLSMQQKLDNLCEQLYNVKEQPETKINMASNEKTETFGGDKINFIDCGCWLCDQHHDLFNPLVGNLTTKGSIGDGMLQYKMGNANEAEQEERRMSDLSDWASSVTSTADVQMNNFAIEHDVVSLRKECEEKDATIKELANFIQSSNVTGSKRISELEDIIRRKNMIITRLKKDMVVLEQKVVQLTRFRRPSSSVSASTPDSWQLPVMADNLLYDMDSTTSPSSSDSDSSPKDVHVNKLQKTPLMNGDSIATSNQKSAPPKLSTSLVKATEQYIKSRPVSPLREITGNQKSNTINSRQKQLSARGDLKKSRRRTQNASKDSASEKRWI